MHIIVIKLTYFFFQDLNNFLHERVEYEMLDSQPGAEHRAGYIHLISNKRK